MFYDKFNSWVTESGSGLLFATGAQFVGGFGDPRIDLAARLVAATIGSVSYEYVYDKNPNGKGRDLLQRQIAIIVFLAIWALIRG